MCKNPSKLSFLHTQTSPTGTNNHTPFKVTQISADRFHRVYITKIHRVVSMWLADKCYWGVEQECLTKRQVSVRWNNNVRFPLNPELDLDLPHCTPFWKHCLKDWFSGFRELLFDHLQAKLIPVKPASCCHVKLR